MKAKTPLDIVIKDANKGGLIIDWQGIVGFLPASQLSTENYPRVEDSDKEKILKELRKA
jgi:small subunit ribosomal protein S1